MLSSSNNLLPVSLECWWLSVRHSKNEIFPITDITPFWKLQAFFGLYSQSYFRPWCSTQSREIAKQTTKVFPVMILIFSNNSSPLCNVYTVDTVVLSHRLASVDIDRQSPVNPTFGLLPEPRREHTEDNRTHALSSRTSFHPQWTCSP